MAEATREEQMRGWLARLHAVSDVAQQVPSYERLLGLVTFFVAWIILPVDAPAAAWCTQLTYHRQCLYGSGPKRRVTLRPNRSTP